MPERSASGSVGAPLTNLRALPGNGLLSLPRGLLLIPFWLIDLSAPQRKGPARLAKLLIDTECRRTTASGILFRTVPSYAIIEDTQLLVERENSLPGAVLARFSTTRWSGVFLARIADGGRLGL